MFESISFKINKILAVIANNKQFFNSSNTSTSTAFKNTNVNFLYSSPLINTIFS